MAHGTDAVHELIVESDLSYPVTVRQIEREHALANIEIDADGNSAMLGEVLARTQAKSFESEADLHRKLAPAFEGERDARRLGIIGRLKRAFLGV